MTDPQLAIVMPAYNEADGIGIFLEEIGKAAADRGVEVVLCVADDASTDATVEAARDEGGRLGVRVDVEESLVNQGHGAASVRAWRLGLASGAPIVVHVDGDGQYRGIDVIDIGLAVAGDGAMAVRVTRADPWFRKLLSTALTWYVRIASGHRVGDANSPLRAYRRRRLEELLGDLPADPMIPSVYLTVAAARRELDIATVPVASRDRRGDRATGTMWGRGRLASLLPSWSLVRFVVRAVAESWSVLRPS